jgi:hypothetical protein
VNRQGTAPERLLLVDLRGFLGHEALTPSLRCRSL